MKKTIALLILTGFLFGTGISLFAQEQEKTENPDIKLSVQTKEAMYNSVGRRDPFKNLMAGKELRGKATPGAVPQLYVEEIVLIGIMKIKNVYTAVISGPQSFPFYLKIGDKLSDGFILSISDTQVVFRKTHERGFPLMKPKDIVKELNPEER